MEARLTGLFRTNSRVSITSFAGSINTKTAYKRFCKKLHQIGVTSEMISKREDEILNIFQSEGAASSSQIGGDAIKESDPMPVADVRETPPISLSTEGKRSIFGRARGIALHSTTSPSTSLPSAVPISGPRHARKLTHSHGRDTKREHSGKGQPSQSTSRRTPVRSSPTKRNSIIPPQSPPHPSYRLQLARGRNSDSCSVSSTRAIYNKSPSLRVTALRSTTPPSTRLPSTAQISGPRAVRYPRYSDGRDTIDRKSVV